MTQRTFWCVWLWCWLGVAAVTSGCSSRNEVSKPAAAGQGLSLGPHGYGCDKPNFGIIWYGPDNRSQKAVPGAANPYFDPHKKTVIMAHGYTYQEYTRPPREWFFTFEEPKTGELLFTAATWIAAGWNVGVFDWRTFSDEDWVIDAEDKIWAPSDGGQLAWRRCDGVMTTEGGPFASVSDLFYEHYLEVMAPYQGDDVRLVGPSLGAQLAASLANRLHAAQASGQVPANLVPKRVALLDPFWSNHLSVRSPTWRGETARQIVARTKAGGMIWELTQVSDFTVGGLIGDRNAELVKSIGVMRYDLSFLADWNPVNHILSQHFFAEKLYFFQQGSGVPQTCSEGVCRALTSAAATDTQAAAFMEAHMPFTQVGGMQSAFDPQLYFAPD